MEKKINSWQEYRDISLLLYKTDKLCDLGHIVELSGPQFPLLYEWHDGENELKSHQVMATSRKCKYNKTL